MASYSYYTPMYQPGYYANNPYQMPQPQPQPAPAPQQPQQQNSPSILWVRNNQEAAMYPVAPNNAIVLWDSSAPVVYLKQADASGKPSMKTYDLVERIEKPTESVPAQDSAGTAYATKSELAALAGVVKDVDSVISSLREEVDAMKTKVSVKRVSRKEEDDG